MKTCDRSGQVAGFWQSPIVMLLIMATVLSCMVHTIVYAVTTSTTTQMVTCYIAAAFGSVLGIVYMWRLSLCKVRRIRRLQFPKLFLIMLLISLKFTFVFASMWLHNPVCFAGVDPASTRWGVFLDMLYFSITNITTLGLGDVAALCHTERIAVAIEMLWSVVLLIFAVAKAAEYAGCPSEEEAELVRKMSGSEASGARRLASSSGNDVVVYMVPVAGADDREHNGRISARMNMLNIP